MTPFLGKTFSIKGVLQHALQPVVHQLLQPSSLDRQAQKAELANPASINLIKATHQSGLYLARQSWPIDYVSGLPLALAAIAQGRPEEWTRAIIQAFAAAWHQSSRPPQLPGLFPPAAQEQPWLTLFPLPTGHMGIRLDQDYVLAWLEAGAGLALISPLVVDQAVLPELPGLSPGELGRRLGLSPLALLQYTHARCHQLLQRQPEAPLGPSLAPAPPFPQLLAGGLSLRQADSQELAHTLIQVLDRLADLPPVPDPGQALRQGCCLAAAVHRWLGPRNRTQILSPEGRALLGSAENGLRLILTQYLKQSAVTAL